ncbi:alpha/beta fold hydrolase [Paractinoplanes maris]|uniref:alpha/beta fold hydrolase n=1 Tax=Paractinoplanes maris TaxID=1734446 RepID=UPI00202278A5|nr:alpha/beta hydrolase [Actinoplanes maris]
MAAQHAILFISGAGLPAWIWDDVRQCLGDGQPLAVAARPAGRSPAGLRDFADAALGSAPTGRFAIVAHSIGGVIGAEIAGLVPERVTAFLGVSAVVPRPGASFLSAMPIPNRWVLSAVMRVAGNRPPDKAIRRGLADRLDEQTTERLLADFTTEPTGLYRSRTPGQSWAGRRGYLFTDRDREVPVAVQRRSARQLGAQWVGNLDTGHLPMLEDPRALAGSITGFLATAPTTRREAGR